MPDPTEQPAKPNTTASPSPAANVDWPIMLSTYFGAMVIFYPLIRWLFHTTENSDQLLHALIVLAAAGMFLLMEKRRRLSLVLVHDRHSVTLLAISFSIVAVCLLPLRWDTPIGLFLQAACLLVAFSLTLAALVRYTLGPIIAKASRGFLVAFTFFMFLALALPVLDWPMRALAGRGSMNLLQKLGVGAELQFANIPSPQLVLSVAGRPFIVAAECNGFGLLSASILLTILLAVYRKLKAVDFLLVLILATVTAFIGNTLRILIIVLLAPHVENYLLMHEIVGLIFFYGALGFLWWFVYGFGRDGKKQA
ncbi:exosortase/archaeosortase family protein [Cerasicoccus frondis]|uniref:exosortase/archaeosortase family protein n=1 Tax=Cerasicoccus frondis TaxID=490090 RepID=UPI00285292CA|nr:exosortase/archaeosortase family protein [Cerasicoccus frondis]